MGSLSIFGPLGELRLASTFRWPAKLTGTSTRIITYVMLCGYSPFRSDDLKRLIRETTDAKVEFHERYWKNVSDKGEFSSSHPHPFFLFAVLMRTIRSPAKNFIRALLNPDPIKRPTAAEASADPVCFDLSLFL